MLSYYNQLPESVNFNHENLPNIISNRFNKTNYVEKLVTIRSLSFSLNPISAWVPENQDMLNPMFDVQI